MNKAEKTARVFVELKLYEELVALKEDTGINIQKMVEDSLDWWLEFKAPNLRQSAEKTFSKRRPKH